MLIERSWVIYVLVSALLILSLIVLLQVRHSGDGAVDRSTMSKDGARSSQSVEGAVSTNPGGQLANPFTNGGIDASSNGQSSVDEKDKKVQTEAELIDELQLDDDLVSLPDLSESQELHEWSQQWPRADEEGSGPPTPGIDPFAPL